MSEQQKPTDAEIAALKEAAEKATPGPWWYDQYGDLRGEGGFRACGVDRVEWLTEKRRTQIEADRLFHRAANPKVIFDLLAERERLREALQQYVNGCETGMIDSCADETLANVTRRARAALEGKANE